MKQLLNNIIVILSVILVLFGCTRSDEYYRDYLKNGEIYYPGRIDSLSIIPGDRKAVLRFRMTTDPKIQTIKAFVRNSLSPNQTVLTFPVTQGDYGKIKSMHLITLKKLLILSTSGHLPVKRIVQGPLQQASLFMARVI